MRAAVQKAKRPGGAGTPAEPQSPEILAQEKQMNSTSDTTAPAAAPEAPVADRLRDAIGAFECPLHEAVSMAKIVTTLVETWVDRRETVMGQPSYVLTDEEGDLLTFAVYRAEMLVKAAQADWYSMHKLAGELRRGGE